MVQQAEMTTWTVYVKMEGVEGEYEVAAFKGYDARITGLAKFLEEQNIPGRPYEYLWGKKRGLIEVRLRKHGDKRRLPRVTY